MYAHQRADPANGLSVQPKPVERLLGQLYADRDYPAGRLLEAAKEYYTKVFGPASSEEKQVVFEITKLPIQIIAPGHGLILKYNVQELRRLYEENGKG